VSARTAVLIVNYYSHKQVGELLASLAASSHAERAVIAVVDNSCDREEARNLQLICANAEAAFEYVAVTACTRNLGYGAGNNRGWAALAHFDPEIVAILNPDTTADMWDFASITTQALGAPTTVFGAETISPSGLQSGLSRIRPISGQSVPLDGSGGLPNNKWMYPDGHCLVMAASLWRSLGGFDERYFLYCEEIDLSIRLRRQGGGIGQLQNTRVKHCGGGTTRDHRAKLSMVAVEHAARSRVVLYRTFPQLRPFLPSLISIRLIRVCVTFVRDRRRATAALRGLRAGLTWHPRWKRGSRCT
jgi:N-acetylglucosaminyl-diphospho-decaprenol L-rhamnosyltransferase